MRYELFIGRRYLKSKRKQAFISLITLISVGGVALGVAALIVVTSVMTGFTHQLTDKILGVYSHLVVLKEGEPFVDYIEVAEDLSKVPGVVASTPFIQTQVMLAGAGGDMTGAVLRGVDVKTAPSVISVKKDMVKGSFDDLVRPEDQTPGVILGTELAKKLGVAVGDTLIMLSPTGGEVSPFGMTPKMKRFAVVGIFDSGMFEYNGTFAYISLPTAQDFLDIPGAVTGIEVRLADVYKAKETGKLIRATLSFSYYVLDWMDMNRNLFAALALQKATLFVILTLIIFVAAFNIASTLIMVVMEKNRDIAILSAMGATKGGIMRIFMFEGFVVGAFGTAIGLILGLGACRLLERYHFIDLDPKIYYFTTLPVQVVASDVAVIIAASLAICLASAVYPAWRASRMDPLDAIRYE
jgi:lipoprotein-releasing system permease protein